jgi:hypothetical protein
LQKANGGLGQKTHCIGDGLKVVAAVKGAIASQSCWRWPREFLKQAGKRKANIMDISISLNGITVNVLGTWRLFGVVLAGFLSLPSSK